MNQRNPSSAIAGIKPEDGSVLPIGDLMERVIAAGDISALTPGDRAHYLVRVADSIGLNPLTRPFDLIPGQGGKLVLYANKGTTDQLRKMYALTSRVISREDVDGVYVVEVEISDGRRAETNIGAVPIAGLKGEALANALMKTITKAKRRATLDFCGLGVLDESEIEGVRAAQQEEPRAQTTWMVRTTANVEIAPPEGETIDAETGEIVRPTQTAMPATVTEAASRRMTADQASCIASWGETLWPEVAPADRKKELARIAGEVTGITNPALLSPERADELIAHLAELGRAAEDGHALSDTEFAVVAEQTTHDELARRSQATVMGVLA